MDKQARAFTTVAWFFVVYIVWSFFFSVVLPNINVRVIAHSPNSLEHPTRALADYLLGVRIVGAIVSYAWSVAIAVLAWNLQAEYRLRMMKERIGRSNPGSAI